MTKKTLQIVVVNKKVVIFVIRKYKAFIDACFGQRNLANFNTPEARWH